ncbi:nuclease-related domain-containing protein [Gracilibacillus lacisalsi]|uniref:nuclease-related domain-containing protein n=1 Tax=Gracilibacillus lacisalsi TaxID=393087 RepID=UPI00037E94BF|nr:nuclease-related domain-containing protein [Gracilibacillus lacisalsi]
MKPDSPILWQQYRALLELLPEQHPEYPNIINQFRRQEAGQAGEDNLAYYLDQAQVPSLTCIKRLRLEHHSAFQLDWLVLGLGFRVIFEVKSHTGEIYFDAKSHQLTRIIDGIKEGFDDPLLQVDRQYANLRAYFIAHNIDQLPTYRFAVFVNPNAILRLHDYPEYQRVLTSQRVPAILENLAEKHPPVISEEANQQIEQFLVENHRERAISILEKHAILWDDLHKGLPCPSCNKRSMRRERMRWQCPFCRTRSTDAHHKFLYQIALLSNNRVTKQLASHFLCMKSPDAARKLMVRAGFIKEGANKNAIYKHPKLIPFY